LSQPKYSLALKDLLKTKAKAEAEKLLEEKRPIIQEQLEQKLDKLLGVQPGQEATPTEGETSTPPPLTPEEQLKEELKKRLKGIF